MTPSTSMVTTDGRLAIDVATFETTEVTVGTDTTFIFRTLDGLSITMVGRGFRFGAGRRLVAGTIKHVFIVDASNGTPIATYDNLSIDVVDSLVDTAAAKRCA